MSWLRKQHWAQYVPFLPTFAQVLRLFSREIIANDLLNREEKRKGITHNSGLDAKPTSNRFTTHRCTRYTQTSANKNKQLLPPTTSFPPKLKTVVNLLLNLFTIHVCVSFSRNRFQWTQGADLFLNVKERKRPTVQGLVEI